MQSLKSKNCLVCNILIEKKPRLSYKQWENKKYCSNKCSATVTAIRLKNNIPWNKNTKGIMKSNRTSWKKQDSRISGKNHRQWLGDNPTYSAIHHWIETKLGKPQYCEYCKTTENRMYHWSNKSGTYKRDINDWWRLCVPCHYKYDRGLLNDTLL